MFLLHPNVRLLRFTFSTLFVDRTESDRCMCKCELSKMGSEMEMEKRLEKAIRLVSGPFVFGAHILIVSVVDVSVGTCSHVFEI